jgi:hypothetical protein
MWLSGEAFYQMNVNILESNSIHEEGKTGKLTWNQMCNTKVLYSVSSWGVAPRM